MPATNKNSVVESRLAELNAELTEVNSTPRRIDEAIAELQRQAEADLEFAQDAEYLDRMTVEGGRKRIMERRREELNEEISRLSHHKTA